jgi:hypothetical protein
MTDAIDAFLANFWKRNPVTATFAGVHDHDRMLPDWSREGRAYEVNELDALIRRLEAEHPVPAGGWDALAGDPVALDAMVARVVGYVRIAEAASGFFTDRNPALWTGEAIFGAISLMLRDFAPVGERLPALAARLREVPDFLQTLHATVEGPIPPAWVARAVRECRAARKLLRDGLPRWLASHEGVADSLEARHVERAATKARDAFRECEAWLLRTKRVDTRPSRAAATDACGEELMGLLLRVGHFADESPRELLARAERALPAARDALAEAHAPYGGTWADAQRAMMADRADATTFLGEFGERWRAVRDAVVAADVVTWPDDRPLRYVPIPAWARAVQPHLYFLFYRSPAPFDPVAVHDYLVAPVRPTMDALKADALLRAWNRSVVGTNHVLHHGGLGHHVQNAAAMRGSSRLGAVAAVDGASRIAMFQGGTMAEGWACYATRLAGELGLLTPLERVAEAQSEVRFLCRAIVDLRLHCGDWSAADCAGFLVDESGMDDARAEAEVAKASMFPGTACMYWLGTDAIVTVRAELERVQGAAFSRRRFHDALLSRGSLPVPLVARLLLATEVA